MKVCVDFPEYSPDFITEEQIQLCPQKQDIHTDIQPEHCDDHASKIAIHIRIDSKISKIG